ncbi:hypothetical protein [Kitasatospora sp. NPDC094011]|uniref:hypothetical protein n=1 Tax=Kitasatospora sp. NPDC094011 TaxID=3364090 RepID=UPI00381ED7F7
MPSDVPRSPGRVPIAIYIAASGGDPGGVLETHCCQYAETRGWVVAAVFIDAGLLPPLEARDGWRGVRGALEAGDARGVVTWTRSMVADTTNEWECLAEPLGELGCFLAAGALDTPGQVLYSRRSEQAPLNRRPEARRAPIAGTPHPASPRVPGGL